MNNSQRTVAIIDRFDNDPKGHDVAQLLEAQVVALHFWKIEYGVFSRP